MNNAPVRFPSSASTSLTQKDSVCLPYPTDLNRNACYRFVNTYSSCSSSNVKIYGHLTLMHLATSKILFPRFDLADYCILGKSTQIKKDKTHSFLTLSLKICWSFAALHLLLGQCDKNVRAILMYIYYNVLKVT